MIPNSWYAITGSSSVKTGKPLGLVRCELAIVLWRDHTGKVVAFPDRCPQLNVKLSLGSIRNSQLECGYHGFRFDPCGSCRLIPANGSTSPVPNVFNVKPLQVAEYNGWLLLWFGDVSAVDLKSIPWFTEKKELSVSAGIPPSSAQPNPTSISPR